MRLLLVLTLLIAAPAGAQNPTYEFQPRADAQEGHRWLERASWKTTGHTLAKLGPVKVRNKTLDELIAYACGVAVQAVDGRLPSKIGVQCRDVVRVEEGKAKELAIDGVDVLGEGLGRERTFTKAEGGKLKKLQREFFERNFIDRGPDDADPLDFLLPDKPVAVGESWDMDLDAIAAFFGPDRIVMDKARSHARVTLTEVVDRGGDSFGRLAFSTKIVPESIKDGEFEQATMKLDGAALLPLRGDLPYQELDLDLDMRFLGSIKAKGVKVNLDLDTLMKGFEKKEPAA